LAFYFSNPKLFVLTIINALNMFLKHGFIDDSPGALVAFSIINLSIFNNFSKHIRIANLSMEFIKRAKAKYPRFRNQQVYYILLGHWQFNIKTILPKYLEIHENSLSVGDTEFASFALYSYAYHSILIGKNLDVLEKEIKKYKKLVKSYEQFHSLTYISILHQFLENLNKPVDNLIQLEGEQFRLSENQEKLESENNIASLVFSYCAQSMLGYLYGDYEYSLNQTRLTFPYLFSIKPLIAFPYVFFFESLALMKIIDKKNYFTKKKELYKIRKNIKKIKIYAKTNPVFYNFKYFILLAEYLSFIEKVEKARKYYLLAIESAGESEILSELSLGYELAGDFFLSQGEREIATYYLKKAYDSYSKWKCNNKCKQLEEKYPLFNLNFTTYTSSTITESNFDSKFSTIQTFSGKDTQLFNTSSVTNTGDVFDMRTIFKAFQTLTGEIDLKKLLEKVMETVLTNAGAENSYLILPDSVNNINEEDWSIKAEGHINKEILIKDFGKSKVPTSIINYVFRTKSFIVLDNAFQKGQFTHDPYIQLKETKSVLCLPLVKQGKLIGVLYLENNLTTNAFTTERINILQLIASQAAISIENARLYNYQVELTNSYSRFVPAEYLDFLQKETVTEVKLGDFIAGEMTVMFSDIRSFTTLSETMTASENFNFVNAYFKRVSPIIAENHGIIVKYIGDAIMSVFKYRTDDAVKSAVEEWNVIKEYNKHRAKSGYIPIKSGFGINRGYMMLGMVGEENRMQGDAFSDHVNLASRLEGLTKYYGVPLIVSENVYAGMINKEVYTFRYLDNVIVKGRKTSVRIYEVLEVYDREEKEKKLEVLEDYKKAIYLYLAGKLKESLVIFQRLEKKDPDDAIMQLYRKRIEYYLLNGIPEVWLGVNEFDNK
ncbi:MAG: GAF domain-containing protein, partial [Leptospiraceae bacterium]|nr:GAF domain-containing protein [Leptospiraceae bacterium]